MRYTRIKITWYCSIAFTILAVLAIFKGMNDVALSAIGGITMIVTVYHGSQGYTKGQYIKSNSGNENTHS